MPKKKKNKTNGPILKMLRKRGETHVRGKGVVSLKIEK